MKLDLDKTNVQLQHTLFQNDGATRTIKRLQLEVGAHNAKIASLEDHLQTQRSEIAAINAANSSFAGPGEDDEDAGSGEKTGDKKDKEFDNLTELWTNRLMEYDANFGKSRRDGAFAGLKARCTPITQNKHLSCGASYEKHQKSAPGVLALCLNPAQFDQTGDVNSTGFRADRLGNVFTGGKDGHVESWNLLSGEQYQRFAAHDDAVTSLSAGVMQVPNPHYNNGVQQNGNGGVSQPQPTYAQHVLVSGCARMHEAKVWVNKARSGAADKWQLKFHLNMKHLREVHVHPLGDLIIITSLEGMIGFADAQTGKWLRKVKADFRESAFQMMAFNAFKIHPNGKAAIAAVGETLQLWDLPKGE